MMQQPSDNNGMNLILAIILSAGILFAWQYFYAEPIRLEAEKVRAEEEASTLEHFAQDAQSGDFVTPGAQASITAAAPRVKINAPRLHGSLSLKGARLDDLTLADYHETIEREEEVHLLRHTNSRAPYFAEFGWVSADGDVATPNAQTVWQSQGGELNAEQPLNLRWNNGQGVSYQQQVAVDENYLFTITMTVRNDRAAPLTLFPYGLVNRAYVQEGSSMFILHEGPLGVLNDTLEEISYKSLREDGEQQFRNSKGWAGITDKYWLTAILPPQDRRFTTSYQYYEKDGSDRYQVDMRGGAVEVAPGSSTTYTMRLFAGAKQVALLDSYGEELNLPLFDRAVDFGALYFLTRPIFELLTWFHALVGNFGLAIMALTVLIKIFMFPLANKSYVAMSQMKLLMPKITELRERLKDDPMKMNQEMMQLYRAEKVNPMSGCLPLLVQLPVFFALYKVLFVTIEMRHTPFFGWIADLSAPDPTNLFTFFGLFDWSTPSWMALGVWPILMCITMVLQQKLNPKPNDPMQAKMIAWMPYLFLFLFATFPAGLVIYWTWNNTLSIIQQWFIMQRYKKRMAKKA